MQPKELKKLFLGCKKIGCHITVYCVILVERAQHEVFLVSMPVLQGQDVYDPGRY